MTVSVQQQRNGPIWPLGNIAVPTPGTPVSIMSLVDPSSVNAPETPTPGTAGADEFTRRAWAIIFFPGKAGAAPPRIAANTGIVYVVLKSVGAGGANDVGSVVVAIRATDPPFVLYSAALNRNDFGLYQIFIDADTAADGCQVTALIM